MGKVNDGEKREWGEYNGYSERRKKDIIKNIAFESMSKSQLARTRAGQASSGTLLIAHFYRFPIKM